MSSQKIFLFRHGENIEAYRGKYVGHLDIPLSEKGRKQAQKINEFISKLKDPIIITSDLQRTFSGLNYFIMKKEELREINFGKWEGLSWSEIEESFTEEASLFLKDIAIFNFPSGESYTNFSKRVIPEFDRVLDKPNENIVFVVHAGVIRAIISEKFNIPLRKIFNFKVDYGKCTVLERVNGHFNLLSLNEDICS
ncbi:MAG: histidine phosphatase family protein [Nanoarchaeota archaeon]